MNNLTYTGEVVAVLFQSDDYMIGKLKTNDNEKITFTGNIFGVGKNELLTITGNLFNHTKYGEQLKVFSWERPVPKGKDQTVEFLSSGLVKGVGKARAIDIVNKLGEDAVRIIQENGEKSLMGIRGIGEKTRKTIVK